MPLGALLALFILIPFVELHLLMLVSMRIGFINTLLLVIITGALGASLARGQGARALGEIRRDLAAGVLPGDSILSGLLVLVGGVMLITPGIMTDFVGLLLLLPPVRKMLVPLLKKHFAGKVHTFGSGRGAEFSASFSRPGEQIKDAEVVEVVSEVEPDRQE